MELIVLAVGVATVAVAGRPLGVLGPPVLVAVLAIDWAPAVAAASATILVAAVTALATIIVARRQRSGTVDTSEAADLWNFSRELMRDLREDLVKSRERIAVLEADRHADSERIADLESKRRDDRDRICDLEAEIAKLKGEAS